MAAVHEAPRGHSSRPPKARCTTSDVHYLRCHRDAFHVGQPGKETVLEDEEEALRHSAPRLTSYLFSHEKKYQVREIPYHSP